MRTTAGKPALERILLGDQKTAARLGEALAIGDPVSRATHGFHTYPAGLHPDAARDLIAGLEAQTVLDPFCGGGTVLVEGRLAGRHTIGTDLSRTALRVARLRTATPDDATITRVRSAARKLTEAAREATEPPPRPVFEALHEWYAPYVLNELSSLYRGIRAADADIQPLLEGIFSSILIKVSWRKSDTSAQRERHHRPPGTAAVLFHKKTRELARRWTALREKMPPQTPATVLMRSDARTLRLREPVDLVLTSPPYPATYDYLPMQHLRRVWFDDAKDADEAELGSRRRWREGGRDAKHQWTADTAAWTANVASLLRPGGHFVVVIGDGLAPSGTVDSSRPTEEAGKAAGLRSIARASVERPDHARGTSRWEHAFLFAKPE